jgi:hypothetical protein
VLTGSDPYEQPCSYHPNVLTRLRCSRCEKPICPRCMVASPVGYRCPDCARGPRPAIYQTSATGLARAIVAGAVVAAAVGVLWGYFPDWSFYCALLLGFGVAESMAWAANYKRGRDLQIAAMSCIALGIAISRATMAYDSPVLTIDNLLNDASNQFYAEAFRLKIIPDFLYFGVSFAIAFVRFR